MTPQQILTFSFVAIAGAYLLRSAWRTLRSKAGCGSGCGKCSAPEAPKPGRIALRQVESKS